MKTILKHPTQLFGRRKSKAATEEYYSSQWRLMYKKFKKHKLARVSLIFLLVLYVVALFAPFIAPQGSLSYDSQYINTAPMAIRWIDAEGKFHLQNSFVYGLKSSRDPVTLRKMYVDDTQVKYPVKLFVEGESYKLWGIIPTNKHLFGVDPPGKLFLFGTDGMGRDLFSRIVLGVLKFH